MGLIVVPIALSVPLTTSSPFAASNPEPMISELAVKLRVTPGSIVSVEFFPTVKSPGTVYGDPVVFKVVLTQRTP